MGLIVLSVTISTCSPGLRESPSLNTRWGLRLTTVRKAGRISSAEVGSLTTGIRGASAIPLPSGRNSSCVNSNRDTLSPRALQFHRSTWGRHGQNHAPRDGHPGWGGIYWTAIEQVVGVDDHPPVPDAELSTGRRVRRCE